MMFSKSMILLLLLGLAATQLEKKQSEVKKVTKLEKDLNSLVEAVQTRDEDLTTLTETMTAQDKNLTTLAALETVITLTETVRALAENLAAQNNKIALLETTKNTLTSKLTALESKATLIIKTPTGSLGNASCLVTCVGSTGAGTTTWQGNKPGYVYTWVDISGCRFTRTPIITASVEGTQYNEYMTHAVRSASSAQFQVRMAGYVFTSAHSSSTWGSDNPTTSTAKTYRWNVNWHATGYVC